MGQGSRGVRRPARPGLHQPGRSSRARLTHSGRLHRAGQPDPERYALVQKLGLKCPSGGERLPKTRAAHSVEHRLAIRGDEALRRAAVRGFSGTLGCVEGARHAGPRDNLLFMCLTCWIWVIVFNNLVGYSSFFSSLLNEDLEGCIRYGYIYMKCPE